MNDASQNAVNTERSVPRLAFDGFVLDPAGRRLLRGGLPVHMEPRVFDLLCFLLRRAGEAVSKDVLLAEVWCTPHVTDWAISRAIAELRRALREHGGDPEAIKTLYGRGYRFVLPVVTLDVGSEAHTNVAERAAVTPAPSPPVPVDAPPRRRILWVLPILVAASIMAALVAIQPWNGAPPRSRPDPGVPLRIAVLPPMGAAAVPDWLRDGLTDDLISHLAHQPRLRVLSRAAGMRLAAHEQRREAAADMGADLGMEISLREPDETLEVTARLVRLENDTVIWSAHYRAPRTQVRALAESIAAATATALLGPDSGPALEVRAVEAADLAFLRGRHMLVRRGDGDLESALGFFDEAIAADAGHAPAWAGKAAAHALLRIYYKRPAPESWQQAQQAAEHALALDPELADAHATLGMIALNARWDFIRAEQGYRRAIELAPSHTQALQWAAELAMLQGRYDEAEARIREAVALDPASPLLIGVWGAIDSTRGALDDAERHFEEALRLDPDFAWLHRELAFLAERRGDEGAALQARRAEMRQRGAAPEALAALDAAMREHGLHGFRRWYLARLEPQAGVDDQIAPELRAETLAALGRHDESEAILRQEGRMMGESILHLLTRSPAFRDPRYRVLMREIGPQGLRIPAA